MKIAFAGTPEFAVPALRALQQSKHQIQVVYTQPDRPSGRGMKLHASAVKQFALEHGYAIEQPQNFRDPNNIETLKNYDIDVMVVAAYGLILPQTVLDTPRYGCINIHPSLLPRWRGATPVQHAILAGDAVTGVTIMQMNAAMDAGDILYQEKFPLTGKETTAELMPLLAELGAKYLLKALDLLADKSITPIKQNPDEVTYAPRLTKEQAKIDWHKPAEVIEREIRAYNPWPVSFTEINGQLIKIWQAEVVDQPANAEPGKILVAQKNRIEIAASNKILQIKKLQMAGGKILTAVEFLNAYAI